jgi:tRNA threonylcarbamoyladenosine biosynthesis protein TsaE
MIFEATLSEGQLPTLLAILEKALIPTYCLYLNGPVGAGKTSLVRKWLYHVGLSEDIPVTSPTFNYVNDYQFGGERIAHIDLYRGEDQNWMEICSGDYTGYMVEWAPHFHIPVATILKLEISFTDSPNTRHYKLT